jgi:hypothetical protein
MSWHILVLTPRDRASDLDLHYRGVVVAGSGESREGPGAMLMEDLRRFRAFRDASAEPVRGAGFTHADVDHLMIYADEHKW